MITVVLNGFKRPHTLPEQYEAIKSQTVDDIDVMFWGNIFDDNIDDFPEGVIN